MVTSVLSFGLHLQASLQRQQFAETIRLFFLVELLAFLYQFQGATSQTTTFCLVQPGHPVCAYSEGLLQLQAAVAGNVSSLASKVRLFNNSNNPCHDSIPDCEACTFNSSACGMHVPGSSSRWYCNFYGIACTNNRITSLDWRRAGIVVQQLPESLHSWDALTTADLSGNTVQGTLPEKWGSCSSGCMSSLTSFRCSDCGLTGTVPAWSDIPLRLLDLSANHLIGTLPLRWGYGSAPPLEELNLNDNPNLDITANNLTFTMPATLRALHVANTRLSGTFPADLPTKATRLTCMNVYDNRQICGAVPDDYPCSVSQGSGGTVLGFDCKDPTVALPAPRHCRATNDTCLPYAITDGQMLAAWQSHLNDPAGHLETWRRLPVNPCQINATWAGVTCNLDRTAVIKLNLTRFGLSGPLGDSLAQLASLQSLDVSFNQLTGSIFPGMGHSTAPILATLETMVLTGNQLVGALPLWSFNNLSCWSVASNPGLCGALSSAWGCGDSSSYNNTNLGVDCSTHVPTSSASSTSCSVISNECATLLSNLDNHASINQEVAIAIDKSKFSLRLPTVAAVGAAVCVDMWLADRKNNSIPPNALTEQSAQLQYQSKTGGANLYIGTKNFTYNALKPGWYSYCEEAQSLGDLWVYFYASSFYMGSSRVSVTSVLPSIINWEASINRTTMHMPGGAAIPLNDGASYTVPPGELLTLQVPVQRANGGTFWREPDLNATLKLAKPDGSAFEIMPLWSLERQAYVFWFNITAGVVLQATVILQHPDDANSMAEASYVLRAGYVKASAAASTITIVSNNATRAGDALYVVANLRDDMLAPVFVADNAELRATGDISGNLSFDTSLTHVQDGAWVAKIIPVRQETITVTLLVDRRLAATHAVNITGISPAFINCSAMLAAGYLTSQSLLSTQYLTDAGLLTAYTGENAYVTIPALDNTGSKILDDPNLKVMLTLVPAAMAAAVVQQYNLPAYINSSQFLGWNTTGGMLFNTSVFSVQNRTANNNSYVSIDNTALLQMITRMAAVSSMTAPSAALKPNSSSPVTTASGGNTTVYDPVTGLQYDEAYYDYEADQAAEANTSLDFSIIDQTDPDTGNEVQDGLGSLSSVYSFFGAFNSFKRVYTVAFNPPSNGTYLAVLSVRHPNVSGSFRFIAFQLTAVPSPAAAYEADDTTSIILYNPLLNPVVCFVASFPFLPSSYGNNLASDLSNILATTGQLKGADWVEAQVVSKVPAVANFTMWFPSNYADIPSPFESVSALQYFTFLLNKLPHVAFTSNAYPGLVATGVQITNFTVTMPGGGPVEGTSVQLSLQVFDADESTLQVALPTGAGLPPPIDMSTIVDREPPILLLIGSVYNKVMQMQSYLDAGAVASDRIDGNVLSVSTTLQLCEWQDWMVTASSTDLRPLACSSTMPPLVDTSQPTAAGATASVFVLTYNTRDMAGNSASPVRRYVLIQARCTAPERWCADLSACSFRGICSQFVAAALGSASISSARAIYVPPVDKTPPQMKLLGDGVAAVSPSGAIIMKHDVAWGSSWTDPGATAIDAADGNLTYLIQSFGAAAVNTRRPTQPDKAFSYVIEYFVEDFSGNAAAIARRLIRVVCPPMEAYCTDPDTAEPTCSTDGVCGKPAILSLTSNPGSVNSIRLSSTALVVPNSPTITLLLPGRVEVPAGAVYDRCADDAALGSLCELGATAQDVDDGNLDRQIMICGNRWQPLGSQKPVPIMLACGVESSIPGDYNLTFSITNSAGRTSTVSRQLKVKAACPEGEQLCSDQTTCSQGGACVAGSTAAPASNSAVTAVNKPPEIKLITTSALGAIVSVKRMKSYKPCSAGTVPDAERSCELGATASDPDSNVTNGYPGALDFTADIVVCPPLHCLTHGCSLTALRKHRFATKGLAGCGIDTAAAVGTEFTVDFWVWDSGSPVLNASVSRRIVISNPCPDPQASHFCEDNSNQHFCSGTPCKQAAKLLPPPKAAPKLRLLPVHGPVYIEYGIEWPVAYNLAPCTALNQTVNCGAVAWDQQGAAILSDLTSYIQVSAVPYCSNESSGQQGCVFCGLPSLTGGSPVNCMPGNYSLVYSVTNDDGIVATATRPVIVFQVGQVSGRVPLKTGLDAPTADDLVQDLSNSSSQAVAAAASSIIQLLATANGTKLLKSDVAIMHAVVAEPAPNSYSVFADVRLYTYEPSFMHRKDLLGIDVPVAATNGRSLLSKDPTAGFKAEHQDSSVTDLLAEHVAMTSNDVCQSIRKPKAQLHSTADSRQAISMLKGLEQLFSSLHQVTLKMSAGAETAYGNEPDVHSSASRRKLGAASDMGSQLSMLSAALETQLGADNVTAQQTTADVDWTTAYLSSISSAVSIISKHTADLSAAGNSLAASLDKTYGDVASQNDDTTDSKLSETYKALLADWRRLVQNVSALSDQAASHFDEETEEAQRSMKAAHEAMQAIAEAGALLKRLQTQYVQQSLMILDRGTLDWNCSRTEHLLESFTIKRDTSRYKYDSQMPSHKRSLLYDNETVAEPRDSWQGYLLTAGASHDNMKTLASEAQPDRSIGVDGHNKVIGGLLLHTTRRIITPDCTGSGFDVKYNFNCQRFLIPMSKDTSAVSRYLASLFASETNNVLPYGVDPVFLRSSSLYNPELQTGWYYNESDTNEVPTATGVPKGFFHRVLQGFEPGFPVLLPNKLSEARSATALQYLTDGNYLDGQTKALSAQLLSYNADLRVLGHVSIDFSWSDSGTISGVLNVEGLPALDSSQDNDGRLAASWVVPLWILSAWFSLNSLWSVLEHIRRPGRQRSWLMVVLASTGCAMDLATAGLMVLATLLLTAYCGQLPAATQLQPSYNVYDAPNQSPARMFLPAKSYVQYATDTGLASMPRTSDVTGTAVLGSMPPNMPGAAGRWMLPDADEDFDHLAKLMSGITRMRDLWTSYATLQGIILVLLIFRFVRMWSFQAKLGITTNTLIRAAPQLIHLLLVIFACIVVFSCLTTFGIGERIDYVSSSFQSFEETFRAMLGLHNVKLADIFPSDIWQSVPQQFLSLIIYYGRAALFMFIYGQYFMAVLGDTFEDLKSKTDEDHARHVEQDIVEDVAPELQLLLQHLLRTVFQRPKMDAYGAGSSPCIGTTCQLQRCMQTTWANHLSLDGNGGSSTEVLEVCGRLFSLATLQQLLASLSSDCNSASVRVSDAGAASAGAAAAAAAQTTTTDIEAGQEYASSSIKSAPLPTTCSASSAAAVQLFHSLHQCVLSEDCELATLDDVLSDSGGVPYLTETEDKLEPTSAADMHAMLASTAIITNQWADECGQCLQEVLLQLHSCQQAMLKICKKTGIQLPQLAQQQVALSASKLCSASFNTLSAGAEMGAPRLQAVLRASDADIYEEAVTAIVVLTPSTAAHGIIVGAGAAEPASAALVAPAATASAEVGLEHSGFRNISTGDASSSKEGHSDEGCAELQGVDVVLNYNMVYSSNTGSSDDSRGEGSVPGIQLSRSGSLSATRPASYTAQYLRRSQHHLSGLQQQGVASSQQMHEGRSMSFVPDREHATQSAPCTPRERTAGSCPPTPKGRMADSQKQSPWC